MAWEVILFTVLGAALIVAAVITCGSLRGQASTRELRAALEAVGLPSQPEHDAPWYPAALLLSQGVIESVHAKARGRMVSGEIVSTLWEGRWKDYQLRDGICILFEGEVSWILPGGPKPYWRGRLAGIRYEQ